jgi:hypothetical protein
MRQVPLKQDFFKQITGSFHRNPVLIPKVYELGFLFRPPPKSPVQ